MSKHRIAFCLWMVLTGSSVQVSADPQPNPKALSGYLSLRQDDPKWLANWRLDGHAISLSRERHKTEVAPVPVEPPGAPSTPKAPRVTSAREMYLGEPQINDYYLSSRIGESIVLSGVAYYKRVAGMPKGELAPGKSPGAGSTSSEFDFVAKVFLTSPDGVTIDFVSESFPISSNSCIDPKYNLPAEQQCLFVAQQYQLSGAIPPSASEGLWSFSVLLEVQRRSPGGVTHTLYSGEIDGEFVIDNTPPIVELLSPESQSALPFPQSAVDMVFSLSDPGSLVSGVNWTSFQGYVNSNPIMITLYSDTIVNGVGDFTGLLGDVIISATVNDLAGNETTSSWVITIFNPNVEPVSAAQEFIQSIRDVLGVSDPATTLVPDGLNTVPLFEGSNLVVHTVSLKQIGPGNIPSEDTGISVDLDNTGFVLSLINGYSAELASLPVPHIVYSATEAENIAESELLASGAVTDVTKAIHLDTVWLSATVHEPTTSTTFIPVHRVFVQTPQEAFRVAVNVENGEVARLVSTTRSEVPTYSYEFDIPAEGNWVIARYHNTYYPYWAENYNNSYGWVVNNYVKETVDGTSSFLMNDAVTPSPKIAFNPANSYFFPYNGLEFSQMNVLYYTKAFNDTVYGLSSVKAKTLEARFGGACSSGSDACYVWEWDTVAAGMVRYYRYVWDDDCSGELLPDGFSVPNNYPLGDAGFQTMHYCGVNPATVVHETNHAIIDEIGFDVDNHYWRAFKEGFAQATQCAYWDTCGQSFFAGLGFLSTIQSYYSLLNEDHYAGGLMEKALNTLNERVKLYGTTGRTVQRGLDLEWGIPYRIKDSGSANPQLGIVATAYKNAAIAGRGGLGTSLFYHDILYAFTEAGIPIGNQVTLSPPSAYRIAVQVPWTRWGGNAGTSSNGFSVIVAGYKGSGTRFLLRFYLTDPMAGTPISCGSTTIPSTAAGEIGTLGASWNGQYTFDAGYLQPYISDCAFAYSLFNSSGCKGFKVYIEAQLVSASGNVLATNLRSDFVNQAPYVLVTDDTSFKVCECRNTCGCETAPIHIETRGRIDSGYLASLGSVLLFGAIYVLRRRRPRNN